MANNKRTIIGNAVVDPAATTTLEYNDASGSKKVSEVGKHLLPIPYVTGGSLTYITNVSGGSYPLPKMGANLAVFNKDTSLHAITLGESATSPSAALAAGATDANGHVGIPCPAGAWTYIACGNQNWVISDNANLIVFLIDDSTSIINTTPAQVGAPIVY